MNRDINPLDIVTIYWENIRTERNVKVIHVPVQTEDIWKFERRNGTIFYVKNFCKMEKVG